MNVRMTYIGGPTVLLEVDGVRLLTDPTFDPAASQRATGPVTLTKTQGPALQPDQVGNVDAVLLSHHHHFDNSDGTGKEFLSRASGVLTTIEGASELGHNAIGMAPWSVQRVSTASGKGVRVTATRARHGPEDFDRGPVIGFVVQPEEDESSNGSTSQGTRFGLQAFRKSSTVSLMCRRHCCLRERRRCRFILQI